MPAADAEGRPTVALTGGTGFIGSAVLRDLAAHGWRIRSLVRGRNRERANVAGVEWIEGNLENPESLDRLLAGARAVVHCAGIIRGRSRRDYERVNVEGVTRIARAAVRQGVPAFVLISSLAAREPGLSPYAASKRGGEERLQQEAGNMRWTVVRPPAVYGPGDREILPLLQWMRRGIVPVLGAGRFSLLYVDDLAEAIRRILQTGAAADRLYLELDDGQPGGYAWGDLAAILEQMDGRKRIRLRIPESLLRGLGRTNSFLAGTLGYAPLLTSGKIRELGHPDWVCDNRRLLSLTGWQPGIRFRQGMELLFGSRELTNGGRKLWRRPVTRTSSKR